MTLAIDVVGDPSAPDAYVNGIMEGAEWAYNVSTGLYEQIKVMPVRKLEEQKVELFREMMRVI